MYRDIVYSALEHKIYGINFELELITSDFNPIEIQTNRSYTKITNLDNSARNLCLDWIQRKLYWIQECTSGLCIIKLDLTLWEQAGIVKYDEINIFEELDIVMFFHVLPSTGYIKFYSSKKINFVF